MTDPATLSAEELLETFRQNTITPLDALQATTERIARLNPGINAFALLDPAALAAAHASTQRWRAGRPIGPLDGVPTTVKDLVDMAGHPTRRGSRTTSPDPAPNDAPIVTALRHAGATIIGKTTTTEFGWKSPGDCPLHGITRNPRDPAHTPGGSSSGAAAAAAAGFGALHVGTDAGGSIRIPPPGAASSASSPASAASRNGPSVPSPPSPSPGPITRTVRDAALMLGALAQHDWRDPFCLPDQPATWLDTIEHGVDSLPRRRPPQPRFRRPPRRPMGSPPSSTLPRSSPTPAPSWRKSIPASPTPATSSPPSGAPPSRLVVANTPPDKRPLLDDGLVALAEAPTHPAPPSCKPPPNRFRPPTPWPGCTAALPPRPLSHCPRPTAPRRRPPPPTRPQPAHHLGPLDLRL